MPLERAAAPRAGDRDVVAVSFARASVSSSMNWLGVGDVTAKSRLQTHNSGALSARLLDSRY